jgi:hypothetical protein
VLFHFCSQLIDDQEFWGGSLGGQLFLQVNPSADDPVLSISVALRYMCVFIPICTCFLAVHIFISCRNCQDDQALYSAFNLSNLIPAGNISSQIQTLVNFSQVGHSILILYLIELRARSYSYAWAIEQ